MEIARWVDWRTGNIPEAGTDRVYFGHETCQQWLPPLSSAARLAEAAKDCGKKITLVTPFIVGVKHLEKVKRLTMNLVGKVGPLEVSTADWGVIRTLRDCPQITLVLSRLLAAQVLDVRVNRLFFTPERFRPKKVRNLHGRWCTVKKTAFGPELMAHCQTCWLDRPMSREFLRLAGIRHVEINYPPMGLKRKKQEDFHFHLHASDVLVAVTRSCSARSDDFTVRKCVPCDDCHTIRPWKAPDPGADFFRIGNALYYRLSHEILDDCTPFVDRIIYRSQS